MKKLKFHITNNMNSLFGQEESFFIPNFREKPSVPWIPYGTHTNEYAINLMELAKNCAIHGTIIQNKVNMITGDEMEEIVDPATKDFIMNVNEIQDLHDIFYNCAYDLTMFGSFALEIIWNRDKTKILKIYHVDASKILYGKRNEKGYVDRYYICDDWTQYRRQDYEISVLPRFKTSDERRELLVSIPLYQAGQLYYTYPDYQQGYREITVLAKIMEYHKNNLDNNFEPGKIITIIGETGGEEEEEIIRELFEESYTGTKNAGAPIINFTTSKENAPIIETLGDDGNHQKYLNLEAAAKEGVMNAHGITSPLLVGVKTPGSLGGGQELAVAQEIFYRYRILTKRNNIEKTFNKLLKINGLEPIKIKDNKIEVMEKMAQNIIEIKNDNH